MCKTPSHFCSQGRGSLAASWARPGDPRSALDGPQHRLSCLRSACCSPSPRSQARGRATTRSRRSARPRSSPPPLRSRRARSACCRSGASTGRASRSSSARRRSPRGRASRSRGRSPATGRGSGWPAGSSTWRSSRSASLAGALTSGARRLAAVVAVVVAAALAWALLGVAVPSLFEDGDRVARLREPVGYWNALALLADGGLALGLWLGRTRRLELRVWGLLLAYGATIALLLTQSRAGIVGAVAVLVLWLAASDRRLADALRAVVAVLPGVAVAGWAFTRPALVEDGALRADRVTDGRTFALLALVGGVVVALAAWRLPFSRLVVERERLVRGVLAVACGRAARGRGRGGGGRGRQPRLVGVVAALGRGVRERPRAAHGSLRQQPPGLVAGVAPARRGEAPRGLGGRHVRDRPEARPRGRELRQRAAQRAAPAPRRPRRRRSRRSGSW